MNRATSPIRAGFPGPRASRRSLLRGGALLGLSVATGVACTPGPKSVSSASAGQAGTVTGEPSQAGHLNLAYKPGQATGWSPPYTPTLGGHIASADFTWQGKAYRVSLLPFGPGEGAPDPIYENVPADATVRFKQTLARDWGSYYTFRYLGGLDGGATFTVESYGAWHGKPPNPRQPGVAVGADLYAVYQPGAGSHPAVNSDLQFIQVLYYQIGKGPGDNQVDTGRANPFYGEGGGLTSIDGNQSVSFSDFIRQGFGGKNLPPLLLIAETFLVQDTRMKDAAGRDIVNIFGGIKWGWRLRGMP
jgi:hypothetical protein